MTRTMLSSILLALVAGAAACGGAEAPATSDTTTTAQAQPAPGTPRDTCVALFERQRACTDLYLPALVDARIANDRPAGIAAKAAEPGGRDAIMATAQSEWATDSTDESISATCDKVLAELPPEQVEGLVGQANQCLATDACQAFVDCVIPLTVSMWQGAPAH